MSDDPPHKDVQWRWWWWEVGHLTKFLLEISGEKFRPPTIPTIRFRIGSKNISRNHRGDKFHIGKIRTSDWKESHSHLPSRGGGGRSLLLESFWTGRERGMSEVDSSLIQYYMRYLLIY